MILQHLLLLSVFLAIPVSTLGTKPGQIKNLVTFGDSYTDVTAHADGGTMWPVFAAQYYGNFTLAPFAHHGATCLGVFSSQIPLYKEEVANATLNLVPEETMYTLWIGTNDVGVSNLFTGKERPGLVSLVDAMQCAVNWVSTMYEQGARNFIFQNMIPLETTILYAVDSYPNRYWTLQRNTTEWHVMIRELTLSGNALARVMLDALAPTLLGAHIAWFDSHALFSDMYAEPQRFLNGTAPLNVTGAVHACVFQLNESASDPGDCTDATGTDMDSFLWYDELHPSVQAERVVARLIVDVIHRRTEAYTTWLS